VQKCIRIFQKEKGSLESHERDGHTMLNKKRRKSVFEDAEKWLGIGYRRLETDPEGG
jgi:hypothetical protein